MDDVSNEVQSVVPKLFHYLLVVDCVSNVNVWLERATSARGVKVDDVATASSRRRRISRAGCTGCIG